MDDSEVESTASILASVKEQEAQFEKLTRALEEERRHVSAQLERVRVSPQDASQTMANGTLTRRHQVKWPRVRCASGMFVLDLSDAQWSAALVVWLLLDIGCGTALSKGPCGCALTTDLAWQDQWLASYNSW